MNSWRSSVGTVGFDLDDGFCRLLDLRLADDILLFARSASEAVHKLDDLLNYLPDRTAILSRSTWKATFAPE